MAIGLAALGLLAFLLGCSGTFAEPQNLESAAKCSLTGTWKSALGNIMEIDSVSDTGVFSGTFYICTVPLRFSSKPVPPSPLQGIQHLDSQPTFGFTVSLSFVEMTIVFAGQCLVDKNGKEQLRTNWVFQDFVESPEEDWEETTVQRSTFYRTE
ncbi:avidin-related protein 1-like [Protobothrops mucrosquamatus]|uniref:avidin-related protein 1-like n=1 Tax=Protobothrops mucrosquamatus TaxID=103944 RepID=UPI000775ED54|nr:avidin-related protein 1-like [Protobothrops mucrosquamatus]XP_015683737.1 avidin-related protein 1-like [Protobothrops mucrosquamatus]